jgi:hypothetical protein
MIFRTKYNRYVDTNNVEVSQQDLQSYLEADGTIYETDFNFPNDLSIEEDEQDLKEILNLENQGIDLVLQHKKRLKRRLINKTTSEENAKEVRKLLRPIWQELKEGDFDWALEDLQGIDQSKLNVEIKREINFLIGKL